MAINVSQAFKRTSIAPIDETLALTKAQMVSTLDTLMPAYYFTICQDDGDLYLYDKSASATASTGKFTKFTGGGGSSDVKFFDTTDTLNPEINGTKNVVAGDLPGVDWDDLVVGSSVIKDAKGTLGLVTAINGSANVTVTTATTSTPTRELTQAQYDALSTADKNNGTIYFVTDSQPNGGTYMGAYETIYSTTEKVIGSYMGKPLYQKTFEGNCNGGNAMTAIATNVKSSLNIEEVVNFKGSVNYNNSGGWLPITYAWVPSNNDYQTAYLSADGTLYCGGKYTGKTIITLCYTKTTDTTSPVGYASPNDYSTSEKIVGTWIDGKALYQRTYSLTIPTSGDVVTTIPDISNIWITDIKATMNGNGSGTVACDLSRPYTGQLTPLWIRSNGEVVMSCEYNGFKGLPFYLTIQYTKVTS